MLWYQVIQIFIGKINIFTLISPFFLHYQLSDSDNGKYQSG